MRIRCRQNVLACAKQTIEKLSVEAFVGSEIEPGRARANEAGSFEAGMSISKSFFLPIASLGQSLKHSFAPIRTSQEHPKSAPRAAKSTPRVSQERPRAAQERQERSQSTLRAHQERPRASKGTPERPKSEPKAHQERPKSAQERPKGTPERPKSAQEHAKGVPRSPRNAPRPPNRGRQSAQERTEHPNRSNPGNIDKTLPLCSEIDVSLHRATLFEQLNRVSRAPRSAQSNQIEPARAFFEPATRQGQPDRASRGHIEPAQASRGARQLAPNERASEAS